MKKRIGKSGKILLMLLYMGVIFGCASNEETEDSNKEQEITLTISSEEAPLQVTYLRTEKWSSQDFG